MKTWDAPDLKGLMIWRTEQSHKKKIVSCYKGCYHGRICAQGVVSPVLHLCRGLKGEKEFDGKASEGRAQID